MLHYLWKFQKWNSHNLFTENNEPLHIIKPGHHNKLAGPDFMLARLEINGQIWAGQVEIHLRASQWYEHRHERDPNYDNVILHVVWEHDIDIYRTDGTVIPTLVMRGAIAPKVIEQYNALLKNNEAWIPCESSFYKVDDFILNHWLERLYFERLEAHSIFIFNELEESKGHWEALLFRILAKNFGLNINGTSFLSLAKSFEFKMIGKCSREPLELEALFMGQSGLLDNDIEEGYFVKLQQRYAYLNYKFKLANGGVITPQFFRLRPSNFPTIRLSQLANLYWEKPRLFSEVIAARNKEELHTIFKIAASDYWDEHYNFGVGSKVRKKWLSDSFIDLLIINTVIPIKYCYSKYLGMVESEKLLDLASEVKSERNAIVKKFNSLKNIAKTASQSQALLQLKTRYCERQKCLDCAIGDWHLKRD